jgi:uncharacterized protein with von Willebrand factor type A (vWA) domain
MQTLTPATTIRWIKQLNTIVTACDKVIDANPLVPHEVWRHTSNTRCQAVVLRDELLELTIASVEVETV